MKHERYVINKKDLLKHERYVINTEDLAVTWKICNPNEDYQQHEGLICNIKLY